MESTERSGRSIYQLDIPTDTNIEVLLNSTVDLDLVVLSIGLGPPAGDLDAAFGLSRDEDGFLIGRPEMGLFVAGAATGPLNVAEARAQAEGTAADVAAYLESGGSIHKGGE